MNGPSLLAFFCTILAAIAALWAAHQNTKKDAEKEQTQLQFEKELNKKNEELLAKSKQIEMLSYKIANLVTGGDSFCYFQSNRLTELEGCTSLFLMCVHHGDDPLYEACAKISDLNKTVKINRIEDALNSYIPISIGNLPTETVLPAGEHKFHGDDSINLNVFFSARNGLFTQKFRGLKVGEKWFFATKVLRRNENDKAMVIYENIDKEFPINDPRNKDWH